MSDEAKLHKDAENLLNYIPYSQFQEFQEKEFLEMFLVYMSGKYTMLPELAQVFGVKEVLKFLYVFSGQHVKVPDSKNILTAFRDIDIYCSLKNNSSSSELERLANKYSTTLNTIKLINEKVAATINVSPELE